MPIHAAQAVRHLWLIDPSNRTLEAYRLESEQYSVLGTWCGEAEHRIVASKCRARTRYNALREVC